MSELLAEPRPVTHSTEVYRALELPIRKDRHGQTVAFNPDELLFMDDGACRAYSPDLFDTDTNHGRTRMRGTVVIDGKTMKKKAQIALAKEVCGLCPVLWECELYIERYPEDEGIWAGTIPEERRHA